MRAASLITVLLSLASCQRRDPLFCGMNPNDPRCALEDGGIIPPGYVIVGGSVSGLNGAGLVLQNNGGDDKLVASNGAFVFATPIPMGDMYAVTVGTEPTNPSQNCAVTNGTGTANDNVTDVQVDCATVTYTVGGTVVGCNGSCPGTLTLTDNNTDDLPVPGNGMFTFSTPLASNTPYAVGVKPGGPVCRVSGGSGIVGNADITSAVVNCNSAAFILSGTPPAGGTSGLNGTVKLHAAYTSPTGSDTIMVSTGSFAFPTPLMTNTTFMVTVTGQPQYPPANQNCTVMGGSGTIAGADYPSVQVNCTTNHFSIGGMVTGLNAGKSVTLQDNGGDSKTVNANGNFTFNTPINSGLTYAATVSSQPMAEYCTVTKGTGTVANGNVTSIVVTCGDPGIKCGNGYCTPGTQRCCDPNGSPSCAGISSTCGGALSLPCDDKADCSGGQLCCAMTHNGNGDLQSVACSASCGGSNPLQLCDPATNECVSGSCQPYNMLPGGYACQ